MDYFSREREENQHLEFKSGEVQVGKILKEVCAFLNSRGGLLIVGSPREAGRNNLHHFKGTPLPSSIPRQRLKRELEQRITPAPRGIRIKEVEIGDGRVYLIEVPQSARPPHQIAATGVYYIRDGASSRPARHDELEKLFMESRKALLDLQIELERPADTVLVRLILQNQSTAAAEEPAFVFEAFPVRQSEKHQEQRIFKNNYLAQGQRWVQEVGILPRDPHFFIACHYYCKNVDVKLKAAFAEIQHNKIKILEVFNSEVHSDFQLWYNQHSYLLDP